MSKGIDFLKIFNVTERLSILEKLGVSLNYKDNDYKEIYITSDMNGIQIYRVLENMNSNYEYENGTYLVEKGCIDNYELVEFMRKNIDAGSDVLKCREDIFCYLKNFLTGDIIDSILIIDSERDRKSVV